MLTVLYISNQGGGAPKSLLNMIKSLRGMIYPIVLFENDWYDYQAFVTEGIECIIVPYRMNMVLDEPGYKTLKWKIHRFIDEWVKNHLAPYRIAKQLRRRNIDIVHTNTGAITIGVKVAKVLGAKHVWHLREFQDVDFGGHPYCGWENFYTLISQSAAVIAITHAVFNHFQLDEHRNAYVIYDAVRSRNDAVWEHDKDNYILYCSSMIVPEKGLYDLIKAYSLSNLPKRGIKLKVLGIMSSAYKITIENAIEKHGLQNNVMFEGSKSKIKPYFSRAKAFVLPSMNEGLGRVVVEAMFYGCPVIVRKAGGPLEYIKEGVNGYFFSTIDELADKLNDVCSINQETVVMAAQKYAIEYFSEEAFAPRIVEIYKNLLENAR